MKQNPKSNVLSLIIEVRTNIVKSMALQLQESSNTIRKEERRLYDNLKKLDFHSSDLEMPEDSSSSKLSETMMEMEMEEGLAQERDQSINHLVDSINQLTNIFKQMGTLVVEQGLIIDRIDYNLENTLHETKKGNEQLVKANQYSENKRARKCIYLLMILIFVFAILLVLKWRR